MKTVREARRSDLPQSDTNGTPKAAPAKPSARRAAKEKPAPTAKQPSEPSGTKLPAGSKARSLRRKLQALVERGINGERDAAYGRLSRLESRYDFTGPDLTTPDLFAGVFRRANVAAPVMPYSPADWDIANGVKYAVEKAARIPCCYRNDSLMAEAAPETANRLHSIAATITESFRELWRQFAATPGVNPADRGNFMAGLTDGMLDEVRTGAALPTRAARPIPRRKAKARAVAPAPGLQLHPYSVAVTLGKQIRFCVPLSDVAGELERTIKGELEA